MTKQRIKPGDLVTHNGQTGTVISITAARALVLFDGATAFPVTTSKLRRR
jgi:hypothetical protein